MALSPDGSKLVVGGLTGDTPQFIVLDPDGFSAPVVLTDSGYRDRTLGTPEFGSMVVTDSNEVWMAGLPDIVLDLSTMSFSTLPEESQAFSQLYGEVLRASADGSHIYSAELNVTSGDVFSIDPSTHAIQKDPSFGYMFWTDLAVSPDGSEVAAVYAPPDAAGDIVGFFYSKLQMINANVYPDFSPPDDSGVLGATFSPDGKVLVVPLGDSLEFWDAATGTLRARVMVPERLHVLVYPEGAVAPQIALDSTGQTIYAISTSGLTVLTLPEPMDQMVPAVWAAAHAAREGLPGLHGTLATRVIAMQKSHHK
jgi:WD40 repeat protein